jgi:hypothetical protein
VEPTESQYLIINALQTLGLLEYDFYDQDRGEWYIATPSAALPISMILQNGDIFPTNWTIQS